MSGKFDEHGRLGPLGLDVGRWAGPVVVVVIKGGAGGDDVAEVDGDAVAATSISAGMTGLVAKFCV